MLRCEPLPCFAEETTLELDKLGPGAFRIRILNIDGSHGGTGPSTLADLDQPRLRGLHAARVVLLRPGREIQLEPGARRPRCQHRPGAALPVYRDTQGGGSNFEYEVVGWAGFRLSGWDVHCSKDSRLHGHFTQVIWEGIASETADAPDFGARAVSLVEEPRTVGV